MFWKTKPVYFCTALVKLIFAFLLMEKVDEIIRKLNNCRILSYVITVPVSRKT